MSETVTDSAGSDEVNELIGGLLSLLIVGVGHMYMGQMKRGAIWLGGSILIGILFALFSILTAGIGLLAAPLLFLIPIGSGIDAYMQGQKINSGEITV